MANEKYPQIMTIVKNSPTDEPVIVSSNIPGSVSFREHEVAFLKRTLHFLEEYSADCRKRSDEYKGHL